MPLSRLQSEILRLLADQRDPESFVAGGAAINRAGPRISRDIDIFHDREERVAVAAEGDARILSGAGYTVRWLRRQPAVYGAAIKMGADETRLETAYPLNSGAISCDMSTKQEWCHETREPQRLVA